MRFKALTEVTTDEKQLKEEYRTAREIGIVRIGDANLFFRKLRTAYYIPYPEIKRCFRRVMLVSASLCCGKGDLPVEHVVLFDGKGEVAQIQMPGEKAAKAVIEALKEKAPQADFTKPAKKEE